jgi:hypothetical protein
MVKVITELTEMIVAQNVATLGNPERGQWWSTAVGDVSQVTFCTGYGLPEVINGVACD